MLGVGKALPLGTVLAVNRAVALSASDEDAFNVALDT
jgi:hypothetical protein